jgi:hypothetical protein
MVESGLLAVEARLSDDVGLLPGSGGGGKDGIMNFNFILAHDRRKFGSKGKC